MRNHFILIAFLISLGFQTSANVSISGCTGTLFTMPGFNVNQNALVLTAGHCMIGIGSYHGGWYLNNNEVLVNYPSTSSVLLKNQATDKGLEVLRKQIIFSTMTGVDLAIVELDMSYKEALSRGFKVYQIAHELPATGKPLVFKSIDKSINSQCEVDQQIAMVKEGIWTWHNYLRMSISQACQPQKGMSGGAGINPQNGLIYTILETVYESTGAPCSDDNPCEVAAGSQKISVGQKSQTYALPTSYLYRCYDVANKKFDFSLPKCGLISGQSRILQTEKKAEKTEELIPMDLEPFDGEIGGANLNELTPEYPQSIPPHPH